MFASKMPLFSEFDCMVWNGGAGVLSFMPSLLHTTYYKYIQSLSVSLIVFSKIISEQHEKHELVKPFQGETDVFFSSSV